MASTNEIDEIKVDEAKIKKAISSGLPITISTFILTHEVKVYMENVISTFLRSAGQERLKNHISYCVHELAANAKKANTKRVYFSDLKLDISNQDDYREGMKYFKQDTLNNVNHYLKLQKEKKLFISLVLQIQKNIIYIDVRNNAVATRTELIRIHDRLARTRQYKTLDEALLQVFDDTEGAGLGLVILILMLKKIGLGEDCFDVSVNDKETIARIIIPLSQVHLENISILSMKIVNSVSSLPQFPEHVLEIRKLLDSKDIEMSEIALRLSKDPTLVAGLLKTVNSAQYMLGKRVNNILDAVNMVGIKGVRNLLYSYETQRILGSDTDEKKHLWEHSYKTAFYAYNLAVNLKLDQDIIDDIYVSGILHDIGKIILSNIHPKLMEKIQNFCIARDIPSSTFEDISSGLNHAEIGALIAEKWNFHENMIMTIRYHHNPSMAPKNCQKMVQTVYFANLLCEYENGIVTFEQFETNVLGIFNISSKEQLDTMVKKFSDRFKKI
ncbi:MAG: HDOD domain-containing protein [Defluviitaleaceae bacterium]|nr:HDOD domain-containing protein [Defluviitaleaceae bacterium]